MDINTIEKEIEELKKQKEENNKKITLFNDQMKIAYLSRAEFSRETIMFFGSIGYLALFTIFVALNFWGINLIQTNLATICFPIIITSSSLIIGTIAKKILFKKKKFDNKLKNFSSAKTETEKLEEEINNMINHDKFIAKNEVLNLAINKLKHKKDILKEVSTQYNLTNKQDIQNKKELIERINKLSNEIKIKYESLDILIHQKKIYEIFLHLNYTLDKAFKLILIPLGIATFSSCFSLLPSILATSIHNTSIFNFILGNQINLILWFLIGLCSSLTIKLIQYKTDKKVLNNITNRLNNIHIIENQKEMDKVNSLIETYIHDIASSIISLKELKHTYDGNNNNSNDFKTKDRTISPISDGLPCDKTKELCLIRKRTINSN